MTPPPFLAGTVICKDDNFSSTQRLYLRDLSNRQFYVTQTVSNIEKYFGRQINDKYSFEP